MYTTPDYEEVSSPTSNVLSRFTELANELVWNLALLPTHICVNSKDLEL
jgi:hypothetical protein